MMLACGERKDVEPENSPIKSGFKREVLSYSNLNSGGSTTFNDNLQGKWKIVKYSISEHANVKKDEAELWLNKEAEFTENTITLNGEVCASDHIESVIVSAEDFFVDEFETNADYLGVPNKLLEVFSMECDYLITDVMLLDDNTSLMASSTGLFFTLEKLP